MATATLAIVGDVHDVWDPILDEVALRHLKPDVVLFAGDFGNEDVGIVRTISELKMPKAAILGNHDCWWFGLSQMSKRLEGYKYSGAVEKQLKLLGDDHVGFGRKDFPDRKLSIVGSRPFSLGGSAIFNPHHCSSIYDVKDMRESARKISAAALSAPKDHSLVFLAHNGPTGLGSQPDDLCGKDFDDPRASNDHGDPDLEEALTICSPCCNIPLVVFGHMHNVLAKRQGYRKMVKLGKDGIVYVNAAVVPRERRASAERNFTFVELLQGSVVRVAQKWILVRNGIAEEAEDIELYSATSS